jgi:WD40 repeat protein
MLLPPGNFHKSLLFSSNGKLIVFGSNDKTIRLRSIQIGGIAKIFNGHTNHVLSVPICADGATIALGAVDRMIKLWDIWTGECNHLYKYNVGYAMLTFSPMDSGQLFSISGSKVQQWGINNCKPEPAYDGSYIAFSPDHTQLALCNGC